MPDFSFKMQLHQIQFRLVSGAHSVPPGPLDLGGEQNTEEVKEGRKRADRREGED